MKHTVLFILFSFLSLVGYSQDIILSSRAEISVITCDPGAELYSSFGHSAFRVIDPVLNIDQAYNYGTFNFKTSNFYIKFARGKLLYDLSSYPFHYFIRDYVRENRTVVEQILNLDQTEKQAMFDFLENNAKPENKSYLYDFFFDNCATKLPEVSTKVLDGNIQMNYEFADDLDYTFRELIHLYLDEKPWGKFGIDLALGSVIDRKATPEEYLFLPDYVLKSYEKAAIQKDNEVLPLVKRTNLLYTSKPIQKKRLFFTPFMLFTLLAIVVFWITYKDFKRNKRTKWLDFLLFFSTGIIGLLVLLLWFATDHSATANNYNFYWAFLPNVYIAFLLLKNEQKKWVSNYFILLLLLLLIITVFWIFKLQVFSIALIPILAILFTRYIFLYRLHR
ncbi:MAG: DUF4105 domain-containing protein [Flavobacteriaceae bacterium]|nr:DUF4105 domain-containing protein [Flavobacteriaceae bacterium]